jgi:hypothetical protein
MNLIVAALNSKFGMGKMLKNTEFKFQMCFQDALAFNSFSDLDTEREQN